MIPRESLGARDPIYILEDWLDKYQKAAEELGLPPNKLIPVENNFAKLSKRLLSETGPGDVLLPKAELVRVERLCLLLQGKTMNCTLPDCWHHSMCQDCPMVEKGWGHSNAVEWML